MNTDQRAALDALRADALKRGYKPWQIANVVAQAEAQARQQSLNGEKLAPGRRLVRISPFTKRHSLAHR